MENYFGSLAARLFARLKQKEVLLLNYTGESSDFTRFNGSRIRHAGRVKQGNLHLDLVHGQRSATAVIQLSGEAQLDLERGEQILRELREQLPHIPDDPWLHYAEKASTTRHQGADELPDAREASADMIAAAGKRDMAGFLACGEMAFGYASSLGQLNWHSDYSFLADWSLHQEGEAAVKQRYHGHRWNKDFLEEKMNYAARRLELLGEKPRQLSPGRYRVFLEPPALYELLRVFGQDGFSLKSHRTAQTCLLRLARDELRLHPQISLRENHAAGRTPAFTQAGFLKPDMVPLVEGGKYQDSLASPRGAKQYEVAVNSAVEHPQSLEMAGGELSQREVFEALDTGIYLGNLWYCNLSDRSHCRITGITRFACLWVENGRPLGPISVMRFDESIYHILGEGLRALTVEREHRFEESSYQRRSEAGATLPGALVDDFTLTL